MQLIYKREIVDNATQHGALTLSFVPQCRIEFAAGATMLPPRCSACSPDDDPVAGYSRVGGCIKKDGLFSNRIEIVDRDLAGGTDLVRWVLPPRPLAMHTPLPFALFAYFLFHLKF